MTCISKGIKNTSDDIIAFAREECKKLLFDGYSKNEAASIFGRSFEYITNNRMNEFMDCFFGNYAICKQCGVEFIIKGNRKVFCSKECGEYYHNHRSHFRGPDGRNRK